MLGSGGTWRLQGESNNQEGVTRIEDGQNIYAGVGGIVFERGLLTKGW